MTGLLTLAFVAGMVAPVNPCGFALLPAWITHTLGDPDGSATSARLLRALRAGAALTIGFAGTLAVAGLVVSAGARVLIQTAPWLGLAIGVLLVLLATAMLAGRSIALRLPAFSGRVTKGLTATLQMVVFGVGYAAASLACTFGVLLAVIAQAQATSSLNGLLLVFGAYAAGSATVLMLVTLVTATAGAALTRRVGRLARFNDRITAGVLLLTGAYLVWYWFPAVTGGATGAGRAGGLTSLSAAVSTWIQGRTLFIGVLAMAVISGGLTLALFERRRHLTPSPLDDCCTTESSPGKGGQHERLPVDKPS